MITAKIINHSFNRPEGNYLIVNEKLSSVRVRFLAQFFQVKLEYKCSFVKK